MWKLAASLLSVAVIGGPVTVALADVVDTRDERPPPIDAGALALESEGVAARGEAEAWAAAAEHRSRREHDVGIPAALEAIAQCESGGNPRGVGGGGAYRGKYQFSPETWASVGGSGDPADAPEAEQDRRAAILYARAGASQWPACGA
jgi:hypothetical protein